MSNAELESQKVNKGELLEAPTVATENIQSQDENTVSVVTDGSEANEFLKQSSDEENETGGECNDAVKALHGDVSKLIDQVSELEKLFETKILHTEHEGKIVDQMHKELQRYKEDMYSQLVRPILLDIIEIRDSILRISLVHGSKPESEQNIPLDIFKMYADDIQEILDKNNIEIYRSEINTDFVPVRQRVIKKTLTDDKSLHGKVAESLSDGYTYMGKTITPEKIAVYLYEPQQEQTETNNKEEKQNG